jgi:hypothetical protein
MEPTKNPNMKPTKPAKTWHTPSLNEGARRQRASIQAKIPQLLRMLRKKKVGEGALNCIKIGLSELKQWIQEAPARNAKRPGGLGKSPKKK